MTGTVRCFVDANLLIHAFRGASDIQQRARTLLNDPNRIFVGSDLLRLEVLPKARYFGRDREVTFYESFFSMIDELIVTRPAHIQRAEEMSSRYGLAAMDSLLLVAAEEAEVNEFVTCERPTKPMFRVESIRVISLAA